MIAIHNHGLRRILLGILVATSLLPDSLRAQWTRQFSGSTVRLTDVVMLDSLTSIAVGYGRTILKTTDAGNVWVKMLSIGFNLNAVAFKDSSTGMAVGDNHLALFTSNRGETWTQRSIGGFGHFLSVAYVDELGIFVGTDGGSLRVSSDGGATWTDHTLTSRPIYRLFFVRGVAEVSYTGFAVTPRFVYKTTDEGVSWSATELPLTVAGSALRGDCSPGGVCYVVGYDGGELPFSRIIRKGPTDSAWTTFQFTQPSPSVVVRGVAAPSATVAYACGSGGLIFRTTDGGAVWNIVPTGLTRRLNTIKFLNEQTGIVVGDSGTILYTTSGTTAVPEEDGTHPSSSVLLQNYPNPFNGETKIGYGVSGIGNGSWVTLRIYDLLGREVAKLVDGHRSPGSYMESFDARGLAGGIYLARLQTGAGVGTRKMLLIR